MTDQKHPWSKDPARDAAARREEDEMKGWRRLEVGEVVQAGDEYQEQVWPKHPLGRRWNAVPGVCVGKPIDSGHLPHRRRVPSAPQHRDLPEALAALTRRVEGLEAVAEAWRQRCEDEADAASVTPPREAAPDSRAAIVHIDTDDTIDERGWHERGNEDGAMADAVSGTAGDPGTPVENRASPGGGAAERSGGRGAAVNADGLRMERVTLEVTHVDRRHASALDWPYMVANFFHHFGESVRVVDESAPAVHHGSGVFDASGDEVPWQGVVAALTRRVEGLESLAEAWRQRCEDEADAASVTPPQWRLLEVGEVIQAGDEFRMNDGEWRNATVVGWELRPTMAPHRRREGEVPSVVFDRLAAERDSAICERDEAIRELHDLAKAVRERESGEECDHSYAAQCREAAAARRLADRMFPAPPQRGWLRLSDEDCAALYLARAALEDVFAGTWREKHDAGCRLDAIRERAIRERDEARARVAELEADLHNAEDEIDTLEGYAERDDRMIQTLTARVAELEEGRERFETALEECRYRNGINDLIEQRDEQIKEVERLKARVAELEAAAAANAGGKQEPPRGWLTKEEREAVKAARHVAINQCLVKLAAVLSSLLASETPPRVKVPGSQVRYHGMSVEDQRDDQWIAAIREAGGEVCE